MSPAFFTEEIRSLGLKVPQGQRNDRNEFTGERFLPGYADGSIELQHIHRYCFALQFAAGKTVLDIACGEGYGCELLGQVASQVIGIDVDPAIVQVARQRYNRSNLCFASGSASEIPLDDQSVDIIVSFETIEHVDDQNAFWQEIKRVLRKTGTLIISSPNRDVYNEQRNGKNPFHVRELTSKELEAELARRFSYHQLFSQANLFGSFIMPMSPEAAPRSEISVDATTRILNWQLCDDSAKPFSVAIACDKSQPEAGQSFYSGDYPPDAMASLSGGIIERDLRVRHLMEQVAASEQKRDEAMLAGKRVEESLSSENRLLAIQRDQAIRQADRLRETLSEQDGVIGALKSLVGEYSRLSGRYETAKTIASGSSSETLT